MAGLSPLLFDLASLLSRYCRNRSSCELENCWHGI